MLRPSLPHRGSARDCAGLRQATAQDQVVGVPGGLSRLQPGGPAKLRGALTCLAYPATRNLVRLQDELHVKVDFLAEGESGEVDQRPEGSPRGEEVQELGECQRSH